MSYFFIFVIRETSQESGQKLRNTLKCLPTDRLRNQPNLNQNHITIFFIDDDKTTASEMLKSLLLLYGESMLGGRAGLRHVCVDQPGLLG